MSGALAGVDDAGPWTVDITTTGRSSGEPRRIEIWMMRVGGRPVIVGSPGRRDWLANLRADPRLTIHLKGEPDGLHEDLAASATEIVDPAERRAVWETPQAEWYRGQASVDELVARSPMVELTLDI